MILDIMAIPLTQGLYALVDGNLFNWLNQWKWYAQKNYNTFYAVRHIWNRNKHKQIRILMHREIMKPPDNLQIDHRNGCGLDNRKQNMRIATYIQNQQNRKIQFGCSCKYKGVSWHKYAKKWMASIRLNGKLLHIGYFNSEIEAAQAYDIKAKELFGEFAHTNY